MRVARRNVPLAAADAIEWGSRRIDIAILGLFVAPYWVGVYYVAQQVASLPQKLKTSFDPILAPVITQKLAEGDKKAVAKQVRQVGFWIIAAQAAIALALGIPGEAVMGLVGEQFVAGTAALAFLLAAEVVAATAAVSEARARLCRPPPEPAHLAPHARHRGGADRRDHPRPRHHAMAGGRESAPGLPGGRRGARPLPGARRSPRC